ncbi:helix-turn-helix domain-containing protein [Streptomyces johnsoniae]|uniref:Helix-turn-helix transcriptional regulator n=1 Tax=Streptomyces johnsoniae TaxID=3075532 RepID=A0ABU2SDL7_9ACTN|nr:helix-turn-helix transcriptional regulator [Streptomyces sp. DSM 41886]MDT0446761.1 helix-turn-helix transcriptional regulator [Streptomyces sp. DSM 41886]
MRLRRLGAKLRRLREAAGIKMDAAAQRIDGDKPKISRIENGRMSIRRLELEALLELYGVTDQSTVAALSTMLKQTRRKGWWHQYSQDLDPDFEERLDLEDDAVRILAFQPLLVPGLLQTEEYAEAVIRSAERSASDGEIGKWVSMRMARQAILTREEAPQLVCVVDEAVLHRQIGGPAALAGQLRRLCDVSAPPELSIQVVPFGQGWHAGLDGGFSVYSYPDPLHLDVVTVDYLDGALYLEDDSSVERYRRAFDQVRASALSSRQSMSLISRLARDLERQV